MLQTWKTWGLGVLALLSRSSDMVARRNRSPAILTSHPLRPLELLEPRLAPSRATLVADGLNGQPTTLFAVTPDHALFRYVSGKTWNKIGGSGTISSISGTTEASGNAVVFVVTADRALFRFDAVSGWSQFGGSGTIRSISAGTDRTGHADVFVITAPGDFFEFSSAGWQQLGARGSILQMSAAGQGRVFVLTATQSVYAHDVTYGWYPETGSGFAQSLSAVDQSTGIPAIFVVTLDGALFQRDSGVWNQIGGSGTIQAVSAGTDANGHADAFVLAASGDFLEFGASGWQQVGAHDSIQYMRAGSANFAYAIASDGAILGFYPQFGLFSLTGAGFGLVDRSDEPTPTAVLRGTFVRSGQTDDGTALTQTFVNGSMTQELVDSAATHVQIATTYNADGSIVRTSTEAGILVAREDWLTNGNHVISKFAADGSLVQRQTSGDVNLSETWDPTGLYVKTQFIGDGIMNRQTRRNGTLIQWEDWSTNGFYSRTVWPGTGQGTGSQETSETLYELKQIFINGQLVLEEAWDAPHPSPDRMTLWTDSGDIIKKSFNDAQQLVLQQTWKASGTIIVDSWNDNGKKHVQDTFQPAMTIPPIDTSDWQFDSPNPYEPGKPPAPPVSNQGKIQEELWDANDGSHALITWQRAGTVQRITYQNDPLFQTTQWKGYERWAPEGWFYFTAWADSRDNKSMDYFKGRLTDDSTQQGTALFSSRHYSNGTLTSEHVTITANLNQVGLQRDTEWLGTGFIVKTFYENGTKVLIQTIDPQGDETDTPVGDPGLNLISVGDIVNIVDTNVQQAKQLIDPVAIAASQVGAILSDAADTIANAAAGLGGTFDHLWPDLSWAKFWDFSNFPTWSVSVPQWPAVRIEQILGGDIFQNLGKVDPALIIADASKISFPSIASQSFWNHAGEVAADIFLPGVTAASRAVIGQLVYQGWNYLKDHLKDGGYAKIYQMTIEPIDFSATAYTVYELKIDANSKPALDAILVKVAQPGHPDQVFDIPSIDNNEVKIKVRGYDNATMTVSAWPRHKGTWHDDPNKPDATGSVTLPSGFAKLYPKPISGGTTSDSEQLGTLGFIDLGHQYLGGLWPSRKDATTLHLDVDVIELSDSMSVSLEAQPVDDQGNLIGSKIVKILYGYDVRSGFDLPMPAGATGFKTQMEINHDQLGAGLLLGDPTKALGQTIYLLIKPADADKGEVPAETQKIYDYVHHALDAITVGGVLFGQPQVVVVAGAFNAGFYLGEGKPMDAALETLFNVVPIIKTEAIAGRVGKSLAQLSGSIKGIREFVSEITPIAPLARRFLTILEAMQNCLEKKADRIWAGIKDPGLKSTLETLKSTLDEVIIDLRKKAIKEAAKGVWQDTAEEHQQPAPFSWFINVPLFRGPVLFTLPATNVSSPLTFIMSQEAAKGCRDYILQGTTDGPYSDTTKLQITTARVTELIDAVQTANADSLLGRSLSNSAPVQEGPWTLTFDLNADQQVVLSSATHHSSPP